MTTLVLSLGLGCLYLADDMDVSAAHFDPARLPWAGKDGDQNPETPPLSRSITVPPLSESTMRLRKGVHLHFRIPDALSGGEIRDSGDGSAPSHDFLPIPTRWTVKRLRPGAETVEWIVESDRIVPEDQDGLGIAYPIAQPRKPHDPPYVRLGVQSKIAGDGETSSDARYLGSTDAPPLTVLGWGDPNFAAFYPACHAMLGFFDPEGQTADHYVVCGRYPGNADPLKLDGTDPKAKEKSRARILHAVRDQVLAKTESGTWETWIEDPDALPSGLRCEGKVVVGQPSAAAPNEAFLQGARLTLAHTGTQALAAELAARFHPPTEGDDKARLDFEDQLNAALLSSELDAKTVDHGPLYAEARHRSGFVPDRSGTVWTLAPMGTAGPADAQNSATTPDVPPDVADKLAALNVLQHALDRAGVALSEARQELYADWCKYLSCAYPDDHGPVLDPDLVRLHIERHSRMHVRQAQDRLENSRKKRDGALAELNRLLAAATPPHEAVAAPADQFWRVLCGCPVPPGQRTTKPDPARAKTGRLVPRRPRAAVSQLQVTC